MPLLQTTVSGTLYDVAGNVVSNVSVYVLRVNKSGVAIQYKKKKVATSDAAGLVSFTVPRLSTAWLMGNFYVSGTKFQVSAGVSIAIPDSATATLESLAAASSVPTQGLTVKANGSSLTNLIGTLDFSSAFTVTESPTGEANVGLTSGSGITNSAGSNVLTKSDGTNLIASRITDDGTDININSGAGETSLGDVAAVGNGTTLSIDDATNSVYLSTDAGLYSGVVAPLTPGVGTIGTVGEPWQAIYVGVNGVNSIQLVGTPTGMRVLTLPDSTGTLATRAYADALVVGLLDDRGNYNASVNTFPASGGSGAAGAILKGDLWTISVGGTLGGTAVSVGDVIRALVDTPGQTAGNWAMIENNFGYVAENSANKVTAFSSPTDVQYPSAKLVSDQLALKANLVSPSFTTPTLGVASATSINKWGFTAPTTAATLVAGADNCTYTFPATSQTLPGLSQANDFSVAGASGAPAMKLSGAWLTSSGAAVAQLLIQQSGAAALNGSTSGNALGIAAATGFAGNLIEAQLNGVSQFKCDATGNVTAVGAVTSNTAIIAASTAYLRVASRLNLSASADGKALLQNSTINGLQALALGGAVPSTIGAAPVNGETFTILQAMELLTIAAAATSTTTMQVPANAVVLAVAVRCTVSIPTATTFTVKIGATTFNTVAVSTTAPSTDPGTLAGAWFNATAQGVVITPSATPGTNAGRVRITVMYYLVTPPTS